MWNDVRQFSEAPKAMQASNVAMFVKSKFSLKTKSHKKNS